MTATAAGKSRGRLASTRLVAWTPPADAAITINHGGDDEDSIDGCELFGVMSCTKARPVPHALRQNDDSAGGYGDNLAIAWVFTPLKSLATG
jgi:hypothetical protein